MKEKSQRRKENNYNEKLKYIGRNTVSKELKKGENKKVSNK